ncbi:aminoglycoside 3'-phosphotransferase [Ornithinibacillus gellani]|uniref:APH(3') family aminoglycoside O-phosphotransferase n=1 Tax=Ornithinibacillus gellani TaxID=2293253 RepID=UPI000F4A3699|nr:APH(3') family aminoglycoside O-phosphotransferase [Ornithinibacillus gellani]TQS76193.1 aminoglycoside 3'-phosphotransferase [Ornithinibacillus gellani]
MHKVPSQLASIITDYAWHPITIGHSEANTYLLKKGYHSLYLKIQTLGSMEPLQCEKDKMEWLRGKLAVPEVIHYEQDEEREYLLMTEIAGVNAADTSIQANPKQCIKLLANGLREIHRIPITACPFRRTLDVVIKEAKERVSQQQVDLDNLDEERRGRTAESLYKELLAKRPGEEDLVFTHGDYCLPNVILHGNKVSGFIDWGRAGVADRYQDIALAIRSLAYNHYRSYFPYFLREYGLDDVDWDKIHYYQLLDEFF